MASKIQERFDTRVLSLDWNDINIGSVPSVEEIKIYSEKYKEKNQGYTGLENWYSSIVDNVPLHVGRFICQRSNLSWDVYLREKYIKYVIIFSFVISFIVLFFGVQYELNIKDIVLNIITPLLPIVTFCIDQYRENKDSIENLKSLREDLNSNWQGLLINNHTPDESYVISRRIQDEIYKNRKDNQLIYDFLYKKYKSETEGAMCYSVNDMINEYNRSVST